MFIDSVFFKESSRLGFAADNIQFVLIFNRDQKQHGGVDAPSSLHLQLLTFLDCIAWRYCHLVLPIQN